MSKADPFSQRFIVPYQNEIDRNGFYEDDLHYIVKINHSDNPWFPNELELERQNDYISLPRALYDHIWEGEYNDSVDNALINAKWFDTCVDAHLTLGFEPLGIRMSSHDPSDEGEDTKGYAFRHGSVVLQVEEKSDGDINEGCDWATGLSIQNQSDGFVWDCDGVCIGLNRQISQAFEGKNVRLSQYKGSEKPEKPDAIYEPINAEKSNIISASNQKKNKEVFKNLRVQKYFELRNRIYRTYEAIVKGTYHDPENMISFSSGITELTKLRSELCRLPMKPNSNGMLDLYPKPVMKQKFKIASPNLADSVKMLWKVPNVIGINSAKRPPTISIVGSTYKDQKQRHGSYRRYGS
jgi:phage terminase large subunit